MQRGSLQKLVVVLLSLNAAILLLLAISHGGNLLPAAWAQVPLSQSTSAQRDVVVAPGQLAGNQWGCYVLDTRTNTLCIYQYSPTEKLLRLQASRAITQDLQLTSFNTSPQPAEVAALVEKERQLQGVRPSTQPTAP